MSAFTAADLAAAAAVGVAVNPYDYNGHVGNMSLTSAIDYVDNKFKWVLSNNGNLDLERTVNQRLLDGQISTANVGNAITDADIADVIEVIGVQFAAYQLLAAMNACGLNIGIRASDCIVGATHLIDLAAADATVALTGQGILRIIRDDEKALEELLADVIHVPRAIVANAIHRSHSEGHNWYTDETNTRKTVAYKACSVGGRKTRDMRAFMTSYGHDLWHVLDDATLFAMADALCGVVAAAPNAPYIYNGIDVNGVNIDVWVDIGEAATDRWPTGILGKAALILGFEYLQFAINHIATKIPIARIDVIVGAIGNEMKQIENDGYTRMDLLGAKGKFGYVIGFGVGYAAAFPDMAERIDSQASISNFVRNNQSGYMVGTTIARTVKQIEVDDEVILNAVEKMIDAIADSF